MNWVYIFIGGGLGSLARYATSVFVLKKYTGNLPIATLTANILSCIVLGLLLWHFGLKNKHNALYFTLIVGFCGGFSTFSTFSLETFELLKNGEFSWAVLNIMCSILLCLAVLFLVYQTQRN